MIEVNATTSKVLTVTADLLKIATIATVWCIGCFYTGWHLASFVLKVIS